MRLVSIPDALAIVHAGESPDCEAEARERLDRARAGGVRIVGTLKFGKSGIREVPRLSDAANIESLDSYLTSRRARLRG